MKKTVLYVLTGFLGSGKTTLLNKLIYTSQMNDQRVAVLINEAGALNFDGEQLPNSIYKRELLNGCMCCSTQSQVAPLLINMLQQSFDTIFIEASGIAHPLDVLDGCLTPDILSLASPPIVLNVVDSPRFLANEPKVIKLKKLIHAQIKHADVNILNKQEQLSRENLIHVRNELRKLNERSLMLEASYGQFEGKLPSPTPALKVNERQTAHADHHLHMNTFVHYFKQPVIETDFKNWLETIGTNVYRVKGYVPFKGENEVTEVQLSFGLPEYTEVSLSKEPQLVFIGYKLNKEQLVKELHQFE